MTMNDLRSVGDSPLASDALGILDAFEQDSHAQVPDASVHAAYGQAATQLSVGEFERVAREAYARLTPEQRDRVVDAIRERAPALQLPRVGAHVNTLQSDPDSLASATAQVHAENPALVQELLAPHGMFANSAAKSALLGIAALATKPLTEPPR